MLDVPTREVSGRAALLTKREVTSVHGSENRWEFKANNVSMILQLDMQAKIDE